MRAGDAGEGEEVVGLAFVAAVAASEPGHSAFYGPEVSAQSLCGLDAFSGGAVLAAAL
jgi:hypothetical protein